MENLSTTDCLFYTIAIKPKALKMLYENKYECPKNHASFTQNIMLYIDDVITQDTYKHLVNLAQQFH